MPTLLNNTIFPFRSFRGENPTTNELRKDMEDMYLYMRKNVSDVNNLSRERVETEAANRAAAITTVTSTVSEALAEFSLSATAQIANMTALVSIEASARIDADGTITASLATEVSARVSGDSALAASVTSEATARISADGALARYNVTVSAMAGLSSHYSVSASAPASPAVNDYWTDTATLPYITYKWNGSTWAEVTTPIPVAGVATEATARATADGYLSGKYTLTVIAGNVVTGMNLSSSSDAGTDYGDVTFLASNFKVYTSAGNVAAFVISGTTVTMPNVTVTGILDVGTGDARFYKPVTGAATYGDTSSGHLSMFNAAVGVAALSMKNSTTTYVNIKADKVGANYLGTFYLYSNDASSSFSITGSATAGTAPTLLWNGDTNLYRLSANLLRTDDDFSCAALTASSMALFGGLVSASYAQFASYVYSTSDVYSTGVGATRVGLLNAAGASGGNTYVGLRYDSTNSRAELAALTGGVAWRDVYIAPNAYLICDNIKFGTHSAIGGESLTGYMLVKDSGGTSRKVAIVS